LPDGKSVKQFKALNYGLGFTGSDRLLITANEGGDVMISDPMNGKTINKLKADLGPRKYGVRAVLYRPAEGWWAYVDGEEGRAVKLSDGTTVLTKFGEATDFALSADGERIWTVGRDAVRLYSVGTWSLEKEWKLRAPTPPTQEPEFALGKSDDGRDFVAVPSTTGLMIYPEDMQNKIATRGSAFIDSSDKLMLAAGPTMQLMSLDGTPRCEWQQHPYHRKALSADGRWLAIADFQQVSVWKMSALSDGCN
jgi:hypothetical protein